MIRFLFISGIIFLLYLGFSVLSGLDSPITINVYKYYIETSFFILTVAFIVILLIALLTLRLIFLLFELPHIIRKRFEEGRIQKTHNAILKAFANLAEQNNKKASQIIKKIKADLNENQKDFAHLILSQAEENFDEQIGNLRALLSNPEYEYYAAKKMAELFLAKKLYQQAEEYCLKCYSINEQDSDLLKLLIECYGSQKKWDRFDFVVNKMFTLDSSGYYLLSENIGKFYCLAARDALENGNDKEANVCLRKSLEKNPHNIEALDLYITLNVNMGRIEDILTMLKSSYGKKPNFAVAQMIIKLSGASTAKELYNNLAELAHPEEFPVMYLAIMAYLGIEEKDKAELQKLLN